MANARDLHRLPSDGGAAASETLLVFDLDNTLVHSQIDFRGLRLALIEVLQRAGATAEPAESLLRLPIPELILIGERFEGNSQDDLVPGMWEIVLEFESAGMAVA